MYYYRNKEITKIADIVNDILFYDVFGNLWSIIHSKIAGLG